MNRTDFSTSLSGLDSIRRYAFECGIESAFSQGAATGRCGRRQGRIAVTPAWWRPPGMVLVPVRPFGYHSPAPMNEVTTQPADHDIDARGLLCPEPLMIVRNKVREINSGEVVYVVATDPSTGRDFHNFCRFMGHELLAERSSEDCFEYWIRKG